MSEGQRIRTRSLAVNVRLLAKDRHLVSYFKALSSQLRQIGQDTLNDRDRTEKRVGDSNFIWQSLRLGVSIFSCLLEKEKRNPGRAGDL